MRDIHSSRPDLEIGILSGSRKERTIHSRRFVYFQVRQSSRRNQSGVVATPRGRTEDHLKRKATIHANVVDTLTDLYHHLHSLKSFS